MGQFWKATPESPPRDPEAAPRDVSGKMYSLVKDEHSEVEHRRAQILKFIDSGHPRFMNLPSPRPENLAWLATVSRSGQVESWHAGCIVATDTTGRVLAYAGDPEIPVFWRSTAKLHQALPLLIAGGTSRFDLNDEQLAVICSSHHGDQRQVACVRSILRQIGSSPEALRCGIHEPWSAEAAKALIRAGESPTPLHHMCSGNHAGLIGLAKLLGANPADYDLPANTAQQSAIAMIARFIDRAPQDIQLGMDGCGIPAYCTPLRLLALAFARWLNVPADWPLEIKSATAHLHQAIVRNPEMLSAAGEIDAELVRAFAGDAICKLGAEGMCAAAFRPSTRWPNGLGLAIKVADGLGNRARDVALDECIQKLELGSPQQRAAFSRFVSREIKTRRGEVVGEISPAFRLTVTS